jgi:hypothetical protein
VFAANPAWGRSIGLDGSSGCGNIQNMGLAVAQILDQAARDNIRLSSYNKMSLASVFDPLWRERLMHCYADRFGLDNPILFARDGNYSFVDRCNVFRELEEAFERHGLKMRIADIENTSVISLRSQVGTAPSGFLSQLHVRHKGVILVNATFWFELQSVDFGRTKSAR